MSIVFLLVVPSSKATDADFGIARGNTISTVESILGPPKGRMILSDGSLVMIYRNGEVDFRKGRVVYYRLSTDKELQKKALERKKMLEIQRRNAQQAKLKKIKTGESEKAQKIEDKAFAQQDPQVQLDYWLGFQKQYPEISVSEQISALRKILQKAKKEEQVKARKALVKRIQVVEQRIEELKNKHGLSRRGVIHARRELGQLRRELPQLKKQLEAYQ